MLSLMMTTKWATDQSAIRTWPCMNIVIFTHNLGNWLIISSLNTNYANLITKDRLKPSDKKQTILDTDGVYESQHV